MKPGATVEPSGDVTPLPTENACKCGGEIVLIKTVAFGIDTAYEECLECGWQGEPE